MITLYIIIACMLSCHILRSIDLFSSRLFAPYYGYHLPTCWLILVQVNAILMGGSPIWSFMGQFLLCLLVWIILWASPFPFIPSVIVFFFNIQNIVFFSTKKKENIVFLLIRKRNNIWKWEVGIPLQKLSVQEDQIF